MPCRKSVAQIRKVQKKNLGGEKCEIIKHRRTRTLHQPPMPTILEDPQLVTLLERVVGAPLPPATLLLLREMMHAAALETLLRQEQNHLLVRVRRRFDLRPLLAACLPCQRYAGRQGQPSTYTLHQLGWALLVQTLYGYSLRQLEHALRTDPLVRWCCGFAVHDPTPDHSTLGRFSRWVQRHAPQVLFHTVLAQIEQDFPQERTRVQFGDTFAMQSCAADSNRTVLLRAVCYQLLACLRQVCPVAHNAVVAQMGQSGRQLLFGEDAEVRDERLAPEARAARECDTARGAAFCLACVQHQIERHAIPLTAFATPWSDPPDTPNRPLDAEQRQRLRLRTWPDLLNKILSDEFISLAPQAEAGMAPPPAARHRNGSKNSKEAPGPYRVVTLKDLLATYRKHGKSTVLGYNIAVIASADFVHHIQAFTGARPDGDTPALLVAAHLHHCGYAPARLVFDRAAGAPKHFAEVAKAGGGAQLVAALCRTGRRGRRFGPDDFTLSERNGAPVLTCPQGETTAVAYRSGTGDGWDYRFSCAQCSAVPCPSTPDTPASDTPAARRRPRLLPPPPATGRCPLWDQCRKADARAQAHRTVFVSDYRQQQRQALAYTATAAFRQEMRSRAAIERIIAGLTRYNGARRARSPGLLAATFQAVKAATAYNLKHWHVLIRRQERAAIHRAGQEPPDD